MLILEKKSFQLSVWWKDVSKTVVMDLKGGFREYLSTAIINCAFV